MRPAGVGTVRDINSALHLSVIVWNIRQSLDFREGDESNKLFHFQLTLIYSRFRESDYAIVTVKAGK